MVCLLFEALQPCRGGWVGRGVDELHGRKRCVRNQVDCKCAVKRSSCVHIHFTCVKIQYLLRSFHMNLLDPL